MRRKFSRGSGRLLIVLGLILALSVPALAYNRDVANNPLLGQRGYAKPEVGQEVVCDVGTIFNRISNSTVEKFSGTNDWTILMGDDSAILPSMKRQVPSNYAAINNYLYFASFRIGIGSKLVHFSTDTSPGITVKSTNNDSTAVSLYDTYFSISDQSPLVGSIDKFNIAAHCKSYAWSESYRSDFIIYDYWILNLNADTLSNIFMALHADCDVSTAEGGSGAQAWSRDDWVAYYRNDVTKEYISYMYDGDNPNVPGDDTGGNKIPKESTGYIGSRLLYCPPIMGSTEPSVQSGHGWWDWNSDPGSDADWMRLMSDGLWLAPPPSIHDYRFLQKLGPFAIPPNDSVRIVFAFGVGEGLSGLRADLAWADSLYRHSINAAYGYKWLGPSAPVSPTFTRLEPGDRQVSMAWDNAAETTPDPATGQVEFEGYRLWKKTGITGNWTLLLESDIIDDIGLNTGLVHEYVDTDVSNGFQYYYVVTAYTKGRPDIGLASFESGKSSAHSVEPGLNVGTQDEAKSGIHVVPNPFVLSSPVGFGFTQTSTNPALERIIFVNLPQAATVTVTVFSLTGDEIIKLTKADPQGRTIDWDLISKSSQKIVAGVYMYVVESDAPGFKNFIGKFMVVR
jgi:hypothetical protein